MQSMAIQHHPSYTGMVTRHRRSSSAPQPSGRFEYPKNRVITLPTLPAIISRPSSPSSVPSISRFRQSHKSLLNAPQHHAHDQLVCSPPDLAHLYGSPLLQAIVHSGQSMSQSFTPAAYGADQTNLGLGEHRRSLSSQSQDYSFLAPSSWTMPTMEQNGFIPMSASTTSFTPTLFDSNMAQANVEEDQSLPEVDLEFFSDFPFNEDIYDLNPEDQNYSPESENPSASASPSPLLNDQCIDGTINPAALRLPAFSGLTPIDTSVHALSRSSSLESEPFSSISSQSTPMMTPSSSFPSSPAPSPSSSISSSDDVDVDFSNLFNVECFDASYSYDAAFSSPPALYEDDGTFGYGFEADNATISSTWPFEEGSIGSKMMDMTTPTQAMFGMEST
ncbi:hypothetical protein CPB84DRAFT_1786062 [Gymnopilus junonius]|uniref:Uncharacterized protein n=1 Tax=Gymnopilus junonius TaxID=109634 RepID=A0A9P5NJB2_GYMJU|nr:hypothetical protein CPB84DRAFT_1786062 [Gymnopilus junonius]